MPLHACFNPHAPFSLYSLLTQVVTAMQKLGGVIISEAESQVLLDTYRPAPHTAPPTTPPPHHPATPPPRPPATHHPTTSPPHHLACGAAPHGRVPQVLLDENPNPNPNPNQVLLDEFDLEKTGRLNFAEFTKMMSQDSMGAGSMERGMNELAPVPPETAP